MAWHNSGNWEGLSVQSLPTIMAEIDNAITERENYRNDTSNALSATASDYYDFTIDYQNGVSDSFGEWVEDKQSEINTLCNRNGTTGRGFTNGNYNAFYTSATIWGDINDYSGWTDPDGAIKTDVNLLYQMKEVLELLKYLHWEEVFVESGKIGYHSKFVASSSDCTPSSSSADNLYTINYANGTGVPSGWSSHGYPTGYGHFNYSVLGNTIWEFSAASIYLCSSYPTIWTEANVKSYAPSSFTLDTSEIEGIKKKLLLKVRADSSSSSFPPLGTDPTIEYSFDVIVAGTTITIDSGNYTTIFSNEIDLGTTFNVGTDTTITVSDSFSASSVPHLFTSQGTPGPRLFNGGTRIEKKRTSGLHDSFCVTDVSGAYTYG